MFLNHKVLLCVLFVLTISSCMSTKAKTNYLREHLLKMGVKYNLKVDYPKYEDISESAKRRMRNSSVKDLKRSLDSVEQKMVTMPDSFAVISNSPNPTNGNVGSIRIDTKDGYITNKNKIKYIRKHHMSGSDIHIVDSQTR